ncbi:MAG: class I SAM-dependent methyltransferase [Gammaproteobacteria bacterium]|nr:class I SAM-dependent methyltransferase [Gammaproteobacteria bacterium]
MPLKAIYNSIASQYDTADCFGSITESHDCAIEQINQANIDTASHCNILDMGVGDGSFLRKIKPYFPAADLTGIDVSDEMLKRAGTDLSLNAIEASAAQATQYVPANSQDLVLAHFINAYIPIKTLFQQAQTLTRDQGHFSIITTTYESFPVAQQHLANFIARESLLSSIVGHYYKAVVKNTTVAAGEEELLQAFDDHKFEVLEHKRLYIPITLNNIDELALFGIEGTWFLNTLSIRMLPKKFLLQRIKRLFHKIFTFPYEDTHVIDVVLAKK